MIIDEEVYLEHFGKKGMRWGVRNENKIPLTKQEKIKRIKKRNRIINRVAFVTGSALFIASLLDSSGKVAAASAKPSRSSTSTVTDLINSERKTQTSSLTRMFKEGRMDSTQYDTFLTTLNKRYDRKIVDAVTSV